MAVTESVAKAKRRLRTPLPGRRVRGSTTGRPIMATLDLLGRRWALRVLWELRQEALSFRDLRSHCDSMSPSVLNVRLAELREAGLLVRCLGEGYRLTDQGQSLLGALAPLDAWAKNWSRIGSGTLQPRPHRAETIGNPIEVDKAAARRSANRPNIVSSESY